MEKNRESIQRFVIAAFLIFLISCMAGWLYEMGFYRINDGRFIKRGQGYGPWLPIYGFGALIIIACFYRNKASKTMVFFGSILVSGVLELVTGMALYHFGGGLRLWDYNTEIWNWGNIGGYVCLRSVLVFGFAGLTLMYMVLPAVDAVTKKLKPPALKAMVIPLVTVVGADITVGYIIRPLMTMLI